MDDKELSIEELFDMDSLEDIAEEKPVELNLILDDDYAMMGYDPEYDKDIQTREFSEDRISDELLEEGLSEYSKILRDTYYIYQKVWQSEKKNITYNSKRLLISMVNMRQSKANAHVSMTVDYTYKECILPVVNALLDIGHLKDIEDAKNESTRMISHIAHVLLGENNQDPTAIMGVWRDTAVSRGLEIKFQGLSLICSILYQQSITEEELVDMLNQQVAITLAAAEIDTGVPEDLENLLEEANTYLRTAPGSRQLIDSPYNVDIAPSERYVVQSESRIDEDYALTGSISTMNTGSVVGQCECDTYVDITKSLGMDISITNTSKRSNQQNIVKARPVVCPNCGKKLLIHRDVLKLLVESLYELLVTSNQTTGNLMSSNLNYTALFIARTKDTEAVSMLRDTIIQKDSDLPSQLVYKESFKKYVGNKMRIVDSINVFKGSISYVLLKENGILVTPKMIAAYIFSNLPEETRAELNSVEIFNRERYRSYISTRIEKELLSLRDTSSVFSAHLGKNVLNYDSVKVVPTPYKEIELEAEDQLKDKCREIMSKKVDYKDLLAADVFQRTSSLNLNRLGKLVESIIFDEDDSYIETFLLSALYSFLDDQKNRASMGSQSIKLPKAQNLTKDLSSKIRKCLNEATHSVNLYALFDLTKEDLNLFKITASDIFSKTFNPIFKNYRQMIVPVIRSPLNDKIEYIYQCRTSKEIRENFLREDTSIELAQDADSKEEKFIEINEDYLLILAMLRAIPKSMWISSDMYEGLEDYLKKD